MDIIFLLCEYYGDVIRKERGRRRSSIIYQGGIPQISRSRRCNVCGFFFVLLNINEFGGIEGKMMKMKSVRLYWCT